MNCPLCGSEVINLECSCGAKFGESLFESPPLSEFILEIKTDKAIRECKKLGINRDQILKYGVDETLELLKEVNINQMYKNLYGDICESS